MLCLPQRLCLKNSVFYRKASAILGCKTVGSFRGARWYTRWSALASLYPTAAFTTASQIGSDATASRCSVVVIAAISGASPPMARAIT